MGLKWPSSTTTGACVGDPSSQAPSQVSRIFSVHVCCRTSVSLLRPREKAKVRLGRLRLGSKLRFKSYDMLQRNSGLTSKSPIPRVRPSKNLEFTSRTTCRRPYGALRLTNVEAWPKLWRNAHFATSRSSFRCRKH